MLDRIITFMRHEAVLCIAFVLACASCLGSADMADIAGHIDWNVIVLLFCLMASVAGLRESGVLTWVARTIVVGDRPKRLACFALVMLPFFASMLVTNDVALLAFTPIAIIALETAGWRTSLARVIVLQAIAANLGGMVTPVGNPQNLFVFTRYGLGADDFFGALAPFGFLAFALLSLACIGFGKDTARVDFGIDEKRIDTRRFALHAALFCLCLLAVFHMLPHAVLLPVVAAALFLFDRHVFAKVDYALLATFVCFFVFSGNMSNTPAVREFLGGLMAGHPMLTSLAASQVISNVPAAVLLSEFTANWHSLLIGVDLGGLGTPIASLASLIALRLYMHTSDADMRTFLREFAVANIVGLAAMVALYACLFVI